MTRATKRKGHTSVGDGDLRQAMGLTEFLHGLGVVMRLPKRQPAAAPEPVAESSAEKPQKPRSRIVWLSASLGSIIVVGLGATALLPDTSDDLPTALVGEWQSPTPKYADRGFAIRDGALYMKRGREEHETVRLPIARVRVRPTNSGSLAVEIAYLENGARLSFDLTLHDYAGTPAVELRNQPEVIWRKATAASPNGAPPAMGLPPAAFR